MSDRAERPRHAGIVLAGGRSSRMGEPKALVAWEGGTLVEHVVARVAAGLDGGPVIVVRAPGQALPDLDAELVDDDVAGEGPLRGLATGLAALDGRADVAFACGVDLPLLTPEFVGLALNAVDDEHDVAWPMLDGCPQPLAAAYRVNLAPVAARLLDSGERRATALGEATRARVLQGVDPGILRDLDTPDELVAARRPGVS